MLKRLSRSGAVPVAGLVALALIGAICARAIVETAKSGVLKKNGKLIWCKMQGKGNEFCDQKYR